MDISDDISNRIVKIARRLEEIEEQLSCNEMRQRDKLLEEHASLSEEIDKLDVTLREHYRC